MTQEVFDFIMKTHNLWLDNNKKGSQAIFEKTNLTDIQVNCNTLNKVIFNEVLFDGTYFNYSTIVNCTFYNCRFINTNITSCTIKRCKFEENSFNNIHFNRQDSDCQRVTINNNYFNNNYMQDIIVKDLLTQDNFYRNNVCIASEFYDSDIEYSYSFSSMIDKTIFENCSFEQSIFYSNKIDNTQFNNCSQAPFLYLSCPQEGSFIGFKTAADCLVKLLIPEDAHRSSATTNKCRCSKVKVLQIISCEDFTEKESTTSDFDLNFQYKVGETIEVKDYNKNRWEECSTGIHFFLTAKEALDYGQYCNLNYKNGVIVHE